MKQTWRWFGPDDPVTLDHAKQAGATGIVTALHQIPVGEAWPHEDVVARKAVIEAAGLEWSVIESIPVHEAIKTRDGDYRRCIENWKSSLRAVGAAGLKTVCYNFMPVLDWTRTDLTWALPTTGLALRFDRIDFAACDLFLIERDGAAKDYSSEVARTARERFDAMTPADKAKLEHTVIAGLPGAEVSYDRTAFRALLDRYDGVDEDAMRSNLADFLSEVVPVAAEEGVSLCVHPDDPPFSIFGLPRVVSTQADLEFILEAHDHTANGITLCSGSLGVRPENDLVGMVRKFGSRIHFIHLRNVTVEPDGSFHEAEHLDGDVDMIGLVASLMEEERRRAAAGQADCEIPMRPDHGHLLGADISTKTNPGYSHIGRLKGLAELRGVMRTIDLLGASA